MDGTAAAPGDRALAHVARRATGPATDAALRVNLNFHPDRERDGVPILAAMADGYRSQFTTGTSNGGLTAHPGGDRWSWESRIFGNAYDAAPPEQRPVYGALNFSAKPVGAAPRFGSAHFRLTADTLPRTTFCYPDSVFEPTDFGVAIRRAVTVLGVEPGGISGAASRTGPRGRGCRRRSCTSAGGRGSGRSSGRSAAPGRTAAGAPADR